MGWQYELEPGHSGLRVVVYGPETAETQSQQELARQGTLLRQLMEEVGETAPTLEPEDMEEK